MRPKFSFYPTFNIVLFASLILVLSAGVQTELNELINVEKYRAQIQYELYTRCLKNNERANCARESSVWVNPIVVNESKEGLYYFGRRGSHGSRTNFLIFFEDKLYFLKGESAKVVSLEAEKILEDCSFSFETRIISCKKIQEIYEESKSGTF